MSPALVIRALTLYVATAVGEAGRTLKFSNGLNLIRADNSSGKSTALQAIIYALGLEGMLSPSRAIPLTHAMTDHLSISGVESNVLRSHVELEIENGQGKVISVYRGVVSPGRDQKLITVYEGPRITAAADFSSRDYFVRASGAAQNEAGFHRYLADFLGLELPRVSKMDGSEAPLYLETLFPYFYVEQKHGWTGLQARMPNYLGIRDVAKRSAEYILGLEAFDQILSRQRIQSNIAELEADWQSRSKDLAEAAKAATVVLKNQHGRIARGLTADQSLPVVFVADQWIELTPAIEILRDEHHKLTDRVIPNADADAQRLQNELLGLEAGLQQTTSSASALWEEQSDLRSQEAQLDLRLAALSDDLQRHKDSRTLQGFGSQHLHELISEHVCPTCHQDLTDGADISAHAMTVEENIAFIDRQIRTFEGSRADTRRVMQAVDVRLSSLTSQANEYRSEIRVVKQTLSSPSGTPSTADIRVRIKLEERIELLRARQESIEEIRNSLKAVWQAWKLQREQLAGISASELSSSDEAKISRVEQSVRAQLTTYKFASLKPSEVDIDRETYRPVNDGFDLGFDLSASDMIRVIWAYLFALLSVGSKGGAHLGLLIFDEPQQQQTARESYQALLAQASTSGATGNQIIFATSETSQSLLAMIGDRGHTIIDLAPGEKLIQPL